MKARQNPLSKFEKWMERIVQAPFAFMFPSKLEPTEVARKLEFAMDDGALLQSAGQRLVPNVYDIYVSVEDYQHLSSAQATLIAQWQESLINFARHKHYTLKIRPILRLHTDSKLKLGVIRIEAKLEDARQMGDGSHTMAGVEATQALSAEQLAQLRAQLLPGQELPGIPNVGAASSNPASGSMRPPTPVPYITIPPARLTIQLPQAGQQVYRIEKPVINIGRQLSNDIIVEDKRVSRNHAQIKYQADGQFAIFDLGSTNGITINGTPHMRQHVLHNGDRFTIGSYDFYFERR
ncbi:MAG: antibiotic biosynthesis regulator FhaA [Ktedonobacteraceae bacterium]